MAEFETHGSVTDEQLSAFAVEVRKHLKGKCKWCPRSFEPGEQLVVGTVKMLQMKWIEGDVEKAEPAGFGEQHTIEIVNAHLPCAIENKDKYRDVTNIERFLK